MCIRDSPCPVELMIPEGYINPWDTLPINAKSDFIDDYTQDEQLFILAMIISIQKPESRTSAGLPSVEFVEELTKKEFTAKQRDELWNHWILRDYTITEEEQTDAGS